jgi:hypothetical protein
MVEHVAPTALILYLRSFAFICGFFPVAVRTRLLPDVPPGGGWGSRTWGQAKPGVGSDSPLLTPKTSVGIIAAVDEANNRKPIRERGGGQTDPLVG